MKKAFTLIELLVVIAIIAILAAILFPVFAQAKVAAKKATVTSNIKQIAMSMFMYQNDNDDYFPRARPCVAYSSLNPNLRDAAHNGSTLAGCSGGQFYNQMDVYQWQKYVMPYARSIDLFTMPFRQKDQSNWDTQGELMNNIVMNLGLTGLKNTSFTDGSVSSYGDLVPFTGGNQSGIPNVSEAALFFDNVPLSVSAFVPELDQLQSGQTSISTLTAYPLAYREFWAFRLLNMTQAGCAQVPQPGSGIDFSKAPAGGITVGRADGSAKFFSANAFLGKCPTQQIMFQGGTASAPTCVAGSLQVGYGYSGTIDKTIPYPMWGFGQ